MAVEEVNYGALGAAALASGDLEAATAASRKHVPLHDRMGLRFVRFDEGGATVTMEVTDEVRGSADGSVHGGMLATLADVACALSVTTSINPETEIQVTTDMHVRYYRQPKRGPIAAKAAVVHRGRRLLSAECVITDADARVLARSTATYMVVPRPY